MSYFYLLIGFIIVILVLSWYRFCYGPYQFLKRLGIPHPPVTPFFGNSLEAVKEGFVEIHDKWIRQYGKVMGFYLGAQPTIVVADLDVLREVMVKHFNNFINRVSLLIRYHPLALLKDNFIDIFKTIRRNYPPGLLQMRNYEWKQNRAIVTPTFSSKKLKSMRALIERSCNSLCERMGKICESKQSVEVWRIFGQFTMETILATSFGRQVNVLNGEGDELTKAASGVFTSIDFNAIVWILTIMSNFPFLASLTSKFAAQSQFITDFHYLQDTALKLVQSRRNSPDDNSMSKDFLHLLMEARAEDSENNEESSKKTLTDEAIVSLSVEFLLAGYETTSNCLGYTAYLLAVNTDKQDKLCQLIQDYHQENEDATLYDVSHGIEYVDWVINESLRMYPPFPRNARNCNETCTINGITFPNGCDVSIPIQSIHYSSEYWDEPNVFRPERFSPEEKEGRHPFSFMPFGWGPRNCIGMRFALMEAKMALVSILRNYKFQVAPDTEIPLKLKFGVTQSPVNGLYLNIIKQ